MEIEIVYPELRVRILIASASQRRLKHIFIDGVIAELRSSLELMVVRYLAGDIALQRGYVANQPLIERRRIGVPVVAFITAEKHLVLGPGERVKPGIEEDLLGVGGIGVSVFIPANVFDVVRRDVFRPLRLRQLPQRVDVCRHRLVFLVEGTEVDEIAGFIDVAPSVPVIIGKPHQVLLVALADLDLIEGLGRERLGPLEVPH